MEGQVFVSDRRFKEYCSIRAILEYSLTGLVFVFGKFEWANRLNYECGDHAY